MATPSEQPAPTERKRSVLAAPRIVRTVEIPDHPGYAMVCWINYPRELRQDITSGDEERIRSALKQIVTEHNGWPDAQGFELPQPSEDGFWDELEVHLGITLLTLISGEALRPPDSALPMNRLSAPLSSQPGAAATRRA